MNKGKKWIWLCLICLLLIGCSGNYEHSSEKKEVSTGFIPARAGMYDSADTAVIKQISQSKNAITFYNLIRGREYTLNFDGATGIYDKYGSSVSMEQINEGDIVDITFLKEKKMLADLKLSNASFKLEDVERFAIDEKKQEIRIGENIYRFEDDLMIFSKGKPAEIMDINQVDTLVVQGIDRVVYSISVDKGHGYLRLRNDEYFWGGWIEVGQEVIRPVEEGMLLVVPEGKYDVILSTGDVTSVKQVTIKRDKETELDVGGLKKEEGPEKKGTLLLAVSPDSADVYIDGALVDISKPCELEYGIHQLMAKAEGYQTVIQYIKVGQENAAIEVVMEKETKDTVSSNSTTVSGNDAVSAAGGKLTIDAPVNVEVYVDGSYVGISPVSFKKTPGIHVITLRASGYQTKSYTINIENVTNSESMSFSALVKEEEEEKEEEKEEEQDSDDEKEEDENDDDDDKDKDDLKEEEDEKQEPEEEKQESDDSSVSQNTASAFSESVSDNNG